MTEEQKNSAIGYLDHIACIELGINHKAWEECRELLLRVMLAMLIAWKIPCDDTSMRDIRIMLEAIRIHVYETNIVNVLAYCAIHAELA